MKINSSDQHQARVLFLQVFLGFLVLFRQCLFTHLGQRLMLFLERGGGGVHLGVGLLHVVDLVVFPLLVPRDLPVSLRQIVPIFTLPGFNIKVLFIQEGQMGR